jgi:hypothetical protein
MTHYHLIGMCREHGPVELQILQDEAEGLRMIHEELPFEYGKGAPVTVTDVYHSPNLVEFTAQIGENTHYLVGFLRICQQDMNFCEMVHMLDAMQKIAEITDRGGPAADYLRNVIEDQANGLPPLEDLNPFPTENTDSSPMFNSIEAFLNQQQEGDDPSAH